MEWLLRRGFWVIQLIGLAIIAALFANTTTALLVFYLVPDGATSVAPPELEGDEPEDSQRASPPGRLDQRTRRAERNAEKILARNLFCPTCGPTPVPEAGPDSGTPGVAHDDELSGARRSTLPLVVAATMESEDPELSVATLVDVERGIGGLFGVGDLLNGEVEIVRVTAGVVHVINAGQLEYIPFDGPVAAPPPSTTRPPASTKPPRPSHALPGAEEAISCNAAGDCVVDRAFVESLIATPKLLVGQGSAAPTTTRDGAPGFKLRRVRKGTLPHLLGLRSGDVITEVGGTPLTLDALTGLFSTLRHASHIELMIDRRGHKAARSLEIRS